MTKEGLFLRREHLKKNASIKKVFNKGIPFKARLITIFLLKRFTESHINRVAFIIRKNLYSKNRKSVLRNRFKRVLREAYRKTKHLLPGDHDVVVLATNIKKDTKSTILQEEMANVFKKCIKK